MTDPIMPDIPADVLAGSRRYGGLTKNLWRLAFVVGIGQFSISIWYWQFGVFMATIIEPWQMGLTFSAGTFAHIVGSFVCGIVSDFIGRRKTLVVGYIPMVVGGLMLYFFPIWPLFPLSNFTLSFGWSFVVLISRAGAADQIAIDEGKDSARTFAMVLLPAFLVDGISPFIASALLYSGYEARILLLLGGLGAAFALVITYGILRETLDTEIQKKARAGPKIAIRGLGTDFWKVTVGFLGLYFATGLAFPYLGNLVVDDWGINLWDYGISWGISSLCIAIITFYAGTYADKKIRTASIIGALGYVSIIFGFGVFEGIFILYFLMIIWSPFVVFWIGSERTLIVSEVSEEKKGRALGTFSFIMSMFSVLASNIGAWIWTFSGSLRYLFVFSGFLGLTFIVILGLVLKNIGNYEKQEISTSPE